MPLLDPSMLGGTASAGGATDALLVVAHPSKDGGSAPSTRVALESTEMLRSLLLPSLCWSLSSKWLLRSVSGVAIGVAVNAAEPLVGANGPQERAKVDAMIAMMMMQAVVAKV